MSDKGAFPSGLLCWCGVLVAALLWPAYGTAEPVDAEAAPGASAWPYQLAGVGDYDFDNPGGDSERNWLDSEHRRAARRLWPVAGTVGFAFGRTASLGSYKGLAFGLWGQPRSLMERSYYFGGRVAMKVYDDGPTKSAWEKAGWQVSGDEGDREKRKNGEDDGTAWDWRMEFEAVAGLQMLRRNWIFFVEGSAMVFDLGVPMEGGTFATLGVNAGVRLVLADLIGFSATVGGSQRDRYRAVIGIHTEGPLCGLIATAGSFLPLVLFVR